MTTWRAALVALAALVAAVCATAGAHAPADPVAIGGVSLVVIEHASLIILGSKTIWVDPVGTVADYEADFVLPPDIILITHPHGDHFSANLIAAVATRDTIVLGPADITGPVNATAGFLGTTRTIYPTNATDVDGVRISAIAAYNLSPQTTYHPKGNNWVGFVVELDGEVLYFSGDTEDTPEMRALTGITVAFVCQNLPNTMSSATAADAVLEFKPKLAIPYHHRGQDINVFRDIVAASDPSIGVLLLNWYPAE